MITHSAQSGAAVVVSDARSLPAPGSEKSWHQIWSASRIPGRWVACCSGVPNIRIEPPVSTRPPMLIHGGTSAIAHSVVHAALCAGVSPSPPDPVGVWKQLRSGKGVAVRVVYVGGRIIK